MDKQAAPLRLPRADTTLEDYMDPMARMDLACDQLKACAAEENRLIERRDVLIKERAAMTEEFKFHAPATQQPAMDRSAGILSRTAAAAMLGGIVTIFAAGTTEKGTAIMHDTVCAAPLVSCDPK